MAFTSAAMKNVNDYLVSIALSSYRTIGIRYEPRLIFDRQLREVIAESAADFAKKNKNKKWLLIGYARSPITYTLKRADVFSERVGDLYEAFWKRREAHNIFKYVFISPSPELLEEVEENVFVRDFGYSSFAEAEVIVYDQTTKEEKYTYPFNECLINIEKFEIQNFDHIDDINNGVFSIFTMNALVNYPVFTIHEVYDMYGKLCTQINLKIKLPNSEKTVIITDGDEYEEYPS